VPGQVSNWLVRQIGASFRSARSAQALRRQAVVSGLLPAWLASALLAAGFAHAEPLVRVRGESRIEIGVAHGELGVSISGALRDELGTPLSGRTLAVEAIPESAPDDPWVAELSTDDGGRFALEIAGADRNYRLLATFRGDATHRGVRVERNVERARDDVRLELKLGAGARINLDAPELTVEVVAESDAGGDGLSMRLTDESGRELARGTTLADGRLHLSVPTERLGPPGAGLLRIESLRDARRAEAQTEARVVRTRAVLLELTPEATSLEVGSPLTVKGRARTRAAPRARVPVGLFVDGQHAETVITDAAGSFESRLWLAAEPGSLTLLARSEGDAASAYPPAETSVVISVLPGQPLPMLWLLGATAVAALGLWGLARVRATSLGERPGEVVEAPFARRVVPRKGQGRRDRMRIDGRVQDLRNDAGVPFAKVSLLHEHPEGSCVLAADDAGRFASPVLPPGRVRLRIESPGFVATEIDLFVPHRGEWTAFAVRLESLRERALAPFRKLALKVLPSPRAWGVWTTREAREWIGRAAPDSRPMLGQLTLDIERACYDEQPPSEEEVGSIEQRTHAVEGTLGSNKGTVSASQTRAAR
jgi:hypothetical protein